MVTRLVIILLIINLSKGGDNMSNRRRNQYYNLNCRIQKMYRNLMLELSMSSFKWTGLEGYADYRTLEMTCFWGGSALFFEDDIMGMLVLPWTPNGNFDVNGNPTVRRAYSRYNSYTNTLTYLNSVIIWNNLMRLNSVDVCNIYAERLWQYDRTVDINVNAQKTPILITATEKQRLSMANLYDKYEGNSPVIFGDKNTLTAENIKAINTTAPFIADKVYDVRSKIWNEALTYLGIANIQITKKERMLTDEVNRQMGGVIACRNSRLRARQTACEKINEMFRTDVWVEFDEENVINTLKDNENLIGEGVIDYESIHNGS